MIQTEPAGAATRFADGAELPAAGRWQIDPGHTELAFVGRHFMLTIVRGRFTGVSGVIQVADVPGDTTVEGISRPVTLQAEYLGYAADPWGGHRAVFTAAGTVNREDWGLTWNMPVGGGGLLVSKEIRIEIELEAVLQP